MKKAVAFSQKAKNYLLDMCYTGEETSNKATASNVASQIELQRGNRPEMLSETKWSIERQIARFFSQRSTLAKTGLIKRSSSVIMNEDEEANADDPASELKTDRTRHKIWRDPQNLDEDNRRWYSCY